MRFLTAFLLAVLLVPPALADAPPTPCDHCGAVLPANALFCPACGQRVEPVARVFCWRCGSSLPLDARYCHHCGTAVPEAAGETPTPAPTPSPRAMPPESPPAGASQAVAAPSTPTSPDTPTATPPVFDGLRLSPREPVFPPRLFEMPTGEILPSLTAHAAAGLAFGFSDDDGSSRWVISFGLGGVGEAMVSSNRIVHLGDPENDALVGFRLKIPVHLASEELGRNLAMALNVSASGDNSYTSQGDFAAADGIRIDSLEYSHRETTLGLAASWKSAERFRLHGAWQISDLRAEDLNYFVDGSLSGISEQKLSYSNFAVGMDYAVNENTRLLAEIRTEPRVELLSVANRLEVDRLARYTAGLRFFPNHVLGLDATLSTNEEAEGLADLEIGFGLHVLIAPSRSDSE